MRATNGGTIPSSVLKHPSALYFAAMLTPLDEDRKNIIRTFVDGLIADGLWDKMDAAYIFTLPQSQQSLINLIDPSESLSQSGTPVFTANSGWRANSGANSLITPKNLNAYDNFTQNSCHMSAYNTWSASANAAVVGTDYDNNGIYPSTAGSGAGTYSCLNVATLTGPVTSPVAAGQLLIGSRTASSSCFTQRNTTRVTGTTTANVAVPATPMYCCYVPDNAATNNFTNRWASFGSGLSTTDADNLNTLVQALISGLDSV